MSHRLRRFPRGVAVLALLHAVAFGIALPSAHGFAAEPVTASAAAERKVSLDFVGADVHTVAKALSIQSGVNVVVMPSITGKVTIRLTQVPLEEALKRVSAAVGSDVRKADNTYYLGSTVELRSMVARNGMKKAVTLKHTPATEVKQILQAALPYLTVDAVDKANVLVLTGEPGDVNAAVQMAEQSDIAPPVVEKPEVKPVLMRDAYTVKHAKAEVLAATLGKAMPELKVTQTERTLVLEGTKEAQEQAAKILAALDQQGTSEKIVRAYTLKYLHPHQVAFTLKPLFPNMTVQGGLEPYSPARANFQPLSIDASNTFAQQGFGQAQGQGGAGGGSAAGGGGAAGGGAAGGGAGQGQMLDLQAPGFRSRTVILQGSPAEVDQATQVLMTLDQAPPQVVIEARMVDMSPETSKQLGFKFDWNPLSFLENNAGSVAAGAFRRSAFGFNVDFEALETRTDLKILAKPNISVIDGEEASIFIGDIVRFERLQSVSDAGQQVFTIEEVPVGVALLCRPRVTDNEVTLRVHPTVSFIKRFTGRNDDVPITSSREAETVVRLKDGETFAIGGLLREDEIKTLSKLPILGDLPLIGQLFRHRNNSKNKSEVTIFLTVRIIK